MKIKMHDKSTTGFGFYIFFHTLRCGAIFRISYDGRYYDKDKKLMPWFGYEKDTSRDFVFYRLWTPYLLISWTLGDRT